MILFTWVNDGNGSISISDNGQDPRCFASNFGWYGSNIRILPQRLKNNAIAPTHSINTKITIKASSGLTIIFGSEIKQKELNLKKLRYSNGNVNVSN